MSYEELVYLPGDKRRRPRPPGHVDTGEDCSNRAGEVKQPEREHEPRSENREE
jgi:hypothetical protein